MGGKIIFSLHMLKIMHTKAEGKPVIWNFWWDSECFFTQLISFLEQQTTLIGQNCCCCEKIMRSWEWELSVFIRSFMWWTSYQLKHDKLSRELSCHFIFSSQVTKLLTRTEWRQETFIQLWQKWKKIKLCVFSPKVWRIFIEVFWWNISLRINLLYLSKGCLW